MKNHSRALRRHHRTRMIQRALRTELIRWQNYHFHEESPFNSNRLNLLKEIAARSCNHLVVCSCSGCGNQRHNKWLSSSKKLTMQERKANKIYKDSVEELEMLEV